MAEKQNDVKQVKMDLEFPLSTKQKLLIGAGITSAAILAFITGRNYERCLLTRGIQICWEEDPTLKEHMWNVLDTVIEKKKL